MITYFPSFGGGGGGSLSRPVTPPINNTDVDGTIEQTANKNVAGGYAGLNASGVIGINRINPSATNGQVLTTLAGATAWATPGGTAHTFSFTAYGVVGSNNVADAAANTTAINNCISDALAAGPGSLVLIDTGGTIISNGGHFLESRLEYKMINGTRHKLNNAQPNGTNLWQTHSFATTTQTIPAAGHSQGEYEFTIENFWLDGNKANNGASWGAGLAIVGFGYTIKGHTFIENFSGPGVWREYNTTQDAPSTDSGHQRASRIESLWLANNDGTSVPAVNQRLTDGKAAAPCGQFTTWGPGDSTINYIEIYRTDSVAGTGFQQLGLDFTAGTFRDFSEVNNIVVVWGNHNIGLTLDSTSGIYYLHAEGANTVFQANANAQELQILAGNIFNIQTSGTLLNFVGSTAHYCYLNLHCTQPQHSGTILTTSSVTCFKGGEVHLTVEIPQAVTITLVSGTIQTSAKILDYWMSNNGAATITAGYMQQLPAGGTDYKLYLGLQPLILAQGTLQAPVFSKNMTALTNTATVTAAQLAGGVIEGTPTAAATYTTDTGTNLSAQFSGEQTGAVFTCTISNKSAGANSITLAGGTGVTMQGNLVIPQNKVAIVEFRNTGANAWTAYSWVSA